MTPSGPRQSTRTRRIGFVADSCPSCQQPRAASFEVVEQRACTTIFGVLSYPVSAWTPVACHTVCSGCGGRRCATPDEFAGIAHAMPNSFDALADLTNPSLSKFGEIESRMRADEDVTRGERLEFLMHHLRTLSQQIPVGRSTTQADMAMLGAWFGVAAVAFFMLDILVGPAGPEQFAGALLATKLFAASVLASVPVFAVRHFLRLSRIRPLVLRFGHVATSIHADRSEIDDVLELARYEDLRIVKYI